MLALDAHYSHPHLFLPQELQPYYEAEMLETQKAGIHPRRIMKKPDSKKKLKSLLKDLKLRCFTGY